jgi:PKD repeat protein
MACACIALALLVAPVPGTMSAPMLGRDLLGTNMEGINHWAAFSGNAQDCANLCDTTAGCAGAVYVPPNSGQGDVAHCWRKSSVTGDTELLSVTSFKKVQSLVVGCILSNPSASFTMLPERSSGIVPFTIQFRDASTGAKSWHWDFGDGTTSALQNPDHTYTAGTTKGTRYTVTLTIAGTCSGESDTATNSVTAYDNIGLFDVHSTPSGATVVFNGRTLSVTTPFTADEGLPVGSYPLVLQLEGYDDYTTLVTIQKGQVTHVDAALVKSASGSGSASGGGTAPGGETATGTLRILSSPDGAAVTVDGGAQGVTPATVAGIAPGSHTVKITSSGYADYQQTLTVSAGKVTEVSVNLVARGSGQDPAPSSTTQTGQSSGTGSIAVASSPSGATVSIDGSEKGTTPLTIQQVKAGSHTLAVGKDGYQDSAATITVNEGMTTSVSLTLVPENGNGGSGTTGTATLTLRSEPPGATVAIDGEQVGTTPLMLQNVPAGTHSILLTLTNYEDYSQGVTLADGADKEMSVSLIATKKSPGFSLPVAVLAFSCIVVIRFRRRNP